MAKKNSSEQEPDQFLQEIFSRILEIYVPVQEISEATCTKNTKEIYEELQELYPSEAYNSETVFHFLYENGFSYTVSGALSFVWLMKNRV
jgi:hypothetical protein